MQQVLKIQSGHESVHRQTDWETDMVKPIQPPSTSLGEGYYSHMYISEMITIKLISVNMNWKCYDVGHTYGMIENTIHGTATFWVWN